MMIQAFPQEEQNKKKYQSRSFKIFTTNIVSNKLTS